MFRTPLTAVAAAAAYFASPLSASAAIIMDGDVAPVACPAGNMAPSQCFNISNGSMTTTPGPTLIDRTWANVGDWAGIYFLYHHSGLSDADETFYAGFIYNDEVIRWNFTAKAGNPYWELDQVSFNVAGKGSHPIQMFIGSDDDFGPVVGPMQQVYQAVPEPSTWAMMIIGFGAVGSMVRTSRRRNALSAA